MARKYHSLLERSPGQLWSIEFGDYDKQVVIQERADRKDSGVEKGTCFTIITTSPAQKMISEAVAQLNADPKLLAKLLTEKKA